MCRNKGEKQWRGEPLNLPNHVMENNNTKNEKKIIKQNRKGEGKLLRKNYNN